MLRPRDADAGGPERPGAATTFFGALDPAAQAAFLGLGREEAFAARSTIFLRGDASDCVYFVRSGRIDVCISSPAGRRLVVTHIDADELLGELSMFDGGVRNVDALYHNAMSSTLGGQHPQAEVDEGLLAVIDRLSGAAVRAPNP